MRQVPPVAILSARLQSMWERINPDMQPADSWNTTALTATRVVSIATAVRRLVEHSCNVELTSRQEKRFESLCKRANDLLYHYGMRLDNPWGSRFYAVPLSHDRSSKSNCTLLA